MPTPPAIRTPVPTSVRVTTDARDIDEARSRNAYATWADQHFAAGPIAVCPSTVS
ncbi:hypothetical protein DFR67_12652 [Williamsia limnetica]|uniref:Uncharacterized protein n=1 Tax=Williamsia limnetica TaxID=882452 RepID=A0A318REJ4_WILLI|nr:hypothetical protein [Williamsia limnetica]PYE12044.1 hypothetical protein DFR67_12652 [Williamsia limnetica]